ncbi:MAG: hypothetical protein AAB970_01240, partial [Patescibacteria group bacterium]
MVTPTLGIANGTSLALGGATIGSNALAVTGTINIAGDTTITNGYKLLAGGGNVEIGSVGTRVNNIYANNIDVTLLTAAGTDISGTQSSTFTINSDNATADTENSSIAFERGSVTPNAIILWDSSADNFNFNYPLYVNSAGNNYFGGNVGIGTASPTAVLHLKAGTTAASTAPLKFTSGALNTTAEAGAIEFLTDAFYGTITTGAARKTFAFLESPVFTGTVTIPTPFTLGATSVTTTGTQLNYLNAATGITGTASTNLVFSTSPTLVTPTLGVATYTTLSGGNITDSALTAG